MDTVTRPAGYDADHDPYFQATDIGPAKESPVPASGDERRRRPFRRRMAVLGAVLAVVWAGGPDRPADWPDSALPAGGLRRGHRPVRRRDGTRLAGLWALHGRRPGHRLAPPRRAMAGGVSRVSAASSTRHPPPSTIQFAFFLPSFQIVAMSGEHWRRMPLSRRISSVAARASLRLNDDHRVAWPWNVNSRNSPVASRTTSTRCARLRMRTPLTSATASP